MFKKSKGGWRVEKPTIEMTDFVIFMSLRGAIVTKQSQEKT